MLRALTSLAANRLLACVLVVAAMAAVWIRTRDYAILGMDSYPAIASGVLRSPADVLTIFTSPAVPGRVPYAFNGFYRPITTISLGIDHALFGVAPHGYFATQALLFGACALALYVLARRLATDTVAPLVALVVFLLAPSHVETLAVVARRSELLCGVFSLLALATQVRCVQRERRWRAALPATFTFLAIISKTTGIAVLPALFVLVLLRAPVTGVVARVREAIWAMLPHLLAVLVAFAIQTIILGGQVGGHIMSRPSGGVDRLPWALGGLAWWLFLPQPGLRASPVTWALLAIATIASATTLALLFRDRRGRGAETSDAWTMLAIGAVWLLANASLYGAVGLLQGWYVFVPALGFALMAGGLADVLVAGAASDLQPLRRAATVALVSAALWIAWQGRYSMLLGSYTQLTRASALTRLYLDDLTARIAAAPADTVIVVPSPPRKLVPEPGEWLLDGPILLPEYAYQSWADCAFPQGRVEIHDRRQPVVSEPSPGAVKVVFKP